MGNEYKLIARISREQKKDIFDILEKNKNFDRKDQSKLNFEFRRSDNLGKMPNTYIVIESDGIYICQNGASYLWTDLNDLKEYFETNEIKYKILDYSE